MSSVLDRPRKAVKNAEVKNITPEEMLRLPDEGHGYELIDGKLVERQMGSESSRAGLAFGRFLGNYAGATGSGWVFGSDLGYRCFPELPNQVRFADASFVSVQRMPVETYTDQGHCAKVPEVVVEAISIHDNADDVEVKIGEWLNAGVSIVWVVYPLRGKVHECRKGRPIMVYTGADTIRAEDVLPGFTLTVAELLQKPGVRS